MLRLVLGAGAVLSPLAQPLLKRRLKRGKEDPARWREKLGEATAKRPDGLLVWIHGVGVGEVMALRGLIERLSLERADLNFLVTSSARSSGDVFARNLPPRTQHQYLPLDLPAPVTRFLDHWRPDLAVWSDQEVWPRLAVTSARRAIPQAYVAARITDASAKARARFGSAYGDLYRLLDTRHAQDPGTAAHLSALMGDDTPVAVTGSIKASGAPLADNPALRAKLPDDRAIWLVASAHPTDMEVAVASHAALSKAGEDQLLIIAPRRMETVTALEQICDKHGMTHTKRSGGNWPRPDTQVFIADSFGELGVWYRAAQVALIGGTFDATEGHNPWEAVALDCAVIHGPRTANFATDFAQLGAADACSAVTDHASLAAALSTPDLSAMINRARAVRLDAALGLDRITTDLLALLKV